MRFLRDSHGGDLCAAYDFSINVSPLGLSGKVRRAIIADLRNADRYPDPYCRELRRALAEKEGVPSENILAGNGAAELIYAYAAYHAKDRAYILSPTFTEYASAFTAYGGSAEYITEIRGFEKISLGKNDTVFVCVPNNPDGMLLSGAELFGLAELCRKAGATLFADACFFDFLREAPYRLQDLLRYENVFVLQAFTKSYAMAGVRLGYLMGKADALQEISRFVQPWSVSSLAQAAGIAAARDTNYLKRLRELIDRERKYLADGLEQIGYSPRPSRANFLLFEGEFDLAERLRAFGIAVRICNDFVGLAARDGMRFFRVAVRSRRENNKLLKALKEVHK